MIRIGYQLSGEFRIWPQGCGHRSHREECLWAHFLNPDSLMTPSTNRVHGANGHKRQLSTSPGHSSLNCSPVWLFSGLPSLLGLERVGAGRSVCLCGGGCSFSGHFRPYFPFSTPLLSVSQQNCHGSPSVRLWAARSDFLPVSVFGLPVLLAVPKIN